MHHQSHGHIYILFDFFWKFCSVAFYNLFYDAYEINFSIECEACIEVHCFRYEHTNVPWHFIEKIILFKLNFLGEESRWQRNRTGRHFLSYKFIKRTIEWWAKFTKQLLIASSGHQVPRKSAHCLWREVGQNIKDKKGDKRAREGDPSWEGSLNRGSFQSAGNPHTGGSEGSFQISEGNLTGRKN